MSTKREKIAAKIAAILRKVDCPSATEAEAYSGMALAQRMADDEGLSLDDIRNNTAEAQDFVSRDVSGSSVSLHPVDVLLGRNIAEFTCCKPWRKRAGGVHLLYFFGHAADVELAIYIRNMLKGAMENGWKWHVMRLRIDGINFNGAAERQSFVKGFADKARKKLLDLSYVRAKPATGTDLIVVKNELLVRRWDDYRAANNIGPGGHGQTQNAGLSGTAYAAGAAVGASVTLNDRTMGGARLAITKR